ncbi:hypothetical protein GS579_25490 [Rhodococcus hoagii]|nr:hypothetical protein [Prescottella equi]
MAGRVASFCSEGDLACATPPNATLARTVTNIAGQLHLEQQDPLRTLTDLQEPSAAQRFARLQTS